VGVGALAEATVPVNGGYLSRVSAVAEKHSSLRRELSRAQPTIVFTGQVRKYSDDRSFGVVAERLIDLVTNCKF
jgi:hypothetical protein